MQHIKSQVPDELKREFTKMCQDLYQSEAAMIRSLVRQAVNTYKENRKNA